MKLSTLESFLTQRALRELKKSNIDFMKILTNQKLIRMYKVENAQIDLLIAKIEVSLW